MDPLIIFNHIQYVGGKITYVHNEIFSCFNINLQGFLIL
jgi:hypothetical protein